MAKAVADYLTICAEVLTQVRSLSRRGQRSRGRTRPEIDGRVEERNRSSEPSRGRRRRRRPSAHLLLPSENPKQRFRLRSVPSIDEVGGPVEGLTCIVTGPTSGIGREIAAALSRRGAHVVLACRSLSKGAALKRELVEEAETRRRDASCPSPSSLVVDSASPSLEVRELDVSDLESVRHFVLAWGDRPLNVLVCNAGIFSMGSAARETTKRDGLESHMATNHLGHFLLAVSLLPRLVEGARSPAAAAAAAKAAARAPAAPGNGGSRNPSFFPSRVVSVSSALHSFADGRALSADPQLFVRGYSPTSAYANSKLAQVMFTAELRRRASGSDACGSFVDGVLSGGGAAAGGGGVARASAASSPLSKPPRPPSSPVPPVVAVAVHPGEVLTDVVRSLPAVVVLLYRKLMSTLLLTPTEGARSAVFAATAAATSGDCGGGDSFDVLPSATDPARCYLFPDCRPRAPSPDVLDPVLGRWLWGWSSAKVGLGGAS